MKQRSLAVGVVVSALRVLTVVVAGMAGFAPSLAGAFDGNLVLCSPTAGIPVPVSFAPGLTCTDTQNKIQITATAKTSNQLDGCTANGAAPWDTWAAGGAGSKITAANAALIKKVDVTFKGSTFGICAPAADPGSYTTGGAGKFAFYDITGANKVKGGKGSFYARFVIDTPSSLIGLVTKGFGAGAQIQIQAGLNLFDPANANLFVCAATGCPGYTGPAATAVTLKTVGGDYLRIDIQNNSQCTANGTPFPCCTGLGAGNCY